MSLGKRLATSAASRMRKDTGESRRSLKIEVRGRGLDIHLLVFSTLVQAKIDAVGLRKGVFPPFKEGSRLHSWAKRRARGVTSARVKITGSVPKRTESQRLSNFQRRQRLRMQKGRYRPPKATRQIGEGSRRTRAINAKANRIAFLVARRIYRRGIKGTQWNRKALEANKSRILREMSNSIRRAMNELKRG